MPSRKRVGVVITGLGIGGAELTLLQQLSHPDMARYEVDIICLYDEDNRLAPKFRELGVNVVVMKVFDYSRHFLLRFNYWMLLRIVRMMRRRRYRLVHTILPHANRVGGIAALLAGVDTWISTLCNMDPGPRPRASVLLDRYLGRRGYAIVGVSRSVCEWDRGFTGLPAGKYRAIYNGVDVEHFQRDKVVADKLHILGVPRDSVVIGSIGRLHELKAFDNLIQAFSMLDPGERNLRLVIAGDGPEREYLEGYARDLGVEQYVELLGFRRDTPEVLSCFDVFALSSISEGLGNVVLEALSMELPVVATDLPAIREVVTQGVTGILVPKRDPQRLADAIDGLLADSATRTAMGARGRKHVVEEFSDVKMVREYMDLYVEAMEVVAPGPSDSPDSKASTVVTG